MLSIVIPIYNVENCLGQCLDSILQNCVCDWEAILVDDGSTDNSGKICDEYAIQDERFKVIHQANKGVSSARNAGIDAANGDWLSFVDSDDVVLCGYAECCSDKETSDLIYFPHEGSVLDDFYAEERNEIEKEILLLKHNDQHFEFFGYTWNKFFKADIIRKHSIRFPEEQKHREDEYFTTEYCRYIKCMKVVHQPLYRYRTDNSSRHLTGRNIVSSELMLLADNVVRQLDIWETKELRDYELFRAKRMMYDAIRKTTSPVLQWPMARKLSSLVHSSPLIIILWINFKKICQKF